MTTRTRLGTLVVLLVPTCLLGFGLASTAGLA